MKGDVMPSIVKMEAEILKDLVKEVKETIATEIKIHNKPKRFGIVDMWNIRRNAKTAGSYFRK